MSIPNDDISIPNMDDPSKPLIKVSIPNSITLTSSNYQSWKTQVEAVLIGYDLYDKHLAGPMTMTMTMTKDSALRNPAYQTWFRQDKLIFGALIGTISSSLFPLVSQTKTAHQLWDVLAKTFDNPTQTRPVDHIVEVIDLTSSPPSSPLKRGKEAEAECKPKRIKIEIVSEGSQMSKKVDRISKLPDDILVHLLSFVDMKTAGRSSLLSKRWRFAWTHLTDLNFDPELFLSNITEINNHINGYVTWVNQVVARNNASNLNTFRIKFPLYDTYVDQIDNWLKFAFNKKVRDLELNLSTLHGNNYFFASRYTFGNRYIRRDFPLIHPVYNDHLTTLRSLHLQGLVLEGPVVENVLAYCLNLERLTVRSCLFNNIISKFSVLYNSPPTRRLVVSSLKLKHLELHSCHNIEALEIFAPKLSSFTFFAEGRKVEVEYTNVPSLVNVTFGAAYCYHLLQNLHLFSNFSYRLQKLSIPCNRETSIIPGFLGLFPIVHSQDNNFLIWTSLIEACPLLHTFKLELWPCRRQAVPMGAQRDVPINHAMQQHNQLKVLELVGFDGSARLADLLFCLTENAPMLNKIICDPHCPPSMTNIHKWYDIEYSGRIPYARGQAELLAKQIRGGIDVVIL